MTEKNRKGEGDLSFEDKGDKKIERKKHMRMERKKVSKK